MGEHRCTLDDKGRLNFPARFREEMGGQFIITRWLDDCVVAFPRDEWDRLSAKLKEQGMAKGRDMRRFLYGGAGEVEPDRQGRVLIPAPLRAHARLEREVVVIGVDWYAEIWDAETWRGMNARLDSAPIAAAMEEMDF